MAYIKNLKQNNDTIYPITHFNAVLNEDGDTIQDVIDDLDDNIQNAGKTLVVTMSYYSNEEVYICDKTQSQIASAYNEGKAIFAKILSCAEEYVYPGMLLKLTSIYTESGILFETTTGSAISFLYSDWGDNYYTEGQYSLATMSNINSKADRNSPSFTGTPTAPTPAMSDNSTKLATTAFVQSEKGKVNFVTTGQSNVSAGKFFMFNSQFFRMPLSANRSLLRLMGVYYARTHFHTSQNPSDININWATVDVGEGGTIDLRNVDYSGYSSLLAYKQTFIVGTLDSNGYLTLDSDWITQTIPSTEDGKLYIHIGSTTETNYMLANFTGGRNIYHYKDGAFRLYDYGSTVSLKTINNNSIVGQGNLLINDIDSVNVTESSVSGGSNVVTITYTNEDTTTFTIKNGADGGSIGDVAIVQASGNRDDAVMTQNATTYNVSTKFGKCLCIADVHTYFKLTPKAVSMLNASDKMTFMFSTRGTGSQGDYRYFGFGNAGTTANGFSNTGAFLYWSYTRNLSANQVSYTLNKTSDNKYPIPDVWMVVWDRVNGIVKFYDRNNLVNTLEDDSYKKDYFVNSNGVIAIKGGDNKTRVYDIRLFDYDFTSLLSNASFSEHIRNLENSDTLPIFFSENYKNANADGSFISHTTTYGSASGWTVTNNGATRTYVNTTTTTSLPAGYYLGTDTKARRWETDIEVVSGVVTFAKREPGFGEIHILDSNDEEVSLSNVGVGTYTLYGINCAVGCWGVSRVSGDVEVVETQRRYKLISCVMHWKCDKLYNNKLYDDETDSFITLCSNRACTTEYFGNVLYDTPQRVIRTDTATLPHYTGEMAIASSKVYIGMPDYTWKQISNA